MHYIKAKDLALIIKNAQLKGEFTPELYGAISLMAERLYNTRLGTSFYSILPLEDIVQESCMRLIPNLMRIDIKRNLFNYLTTLIINTRTRLHTIEVRHVHEELEGDEW